MFTRAKLDFVGLLVPIKCIKKFMFKSVHDFMYKVKSLLNQTHIVSSMAAKEHLHRIASL